MPDQLIESLTKWFQSAPDDVKAMIAQQTANVTGEKVSKSDANYRRSDSDQSCGNCVHFDGHGACAVVAGSIDPGYVSDHWKATGDGEQPAGDSGVSPGDGGAGGSDSPNSNEQDGA